MVEENKIREYASKDLKLCESGGLKRVIKYLRMAAEQGNVLVITNLGHAIEVIS